MLLLNLSLILEDIAFSFTTNICFSNYQMFEKHESKTETEECTIKSILLHLSYKKDLMVDEAICCQGIEIFSDVEQVLMF